MFSLYINDLALELINLEKGILVAGCRISILLYADDIVILAQSEHDLQEMINVIYNWCGKWQMEVNVSKTNVVHFRKLNQPKTNYNFKYGNIDIAVSDKYKYLGCILNDTLDFSVTANVLSEAAGRGLGSLINKMKNSKGLFFKTYTNLYDKCVVPISDYCSGVWGYKNHISCNKIQHRAQRAYLGVHRYTSNVMIEGDTGWTPCNIRRKIDMLRLWGRLVNMENNRLTKIIFLWDHKICRQNWSNEVKNILNEAEIDISLFYNTVHVKNLGSLLIKVKDKLMENYKKLWYQNLYKQDKLRTYRIFKNNYVTENYLHMNIPFNLRSLICQIRAGVLPLAIEVGRFTNIPVSSRICKFCDANTVESEMHFIFECVAYEKYRKNLFDHIETIFSDFKTLSISKRWNILMTHEQVIKKFGCFLKYAYQTRNDILYRM